MRDVILMAECTVQEPDDQGGITYTQEYEVCIVSMDILFQRIGRGQLAQPVFQVFKTLGKEEAKCIFNKAILDEIYEDIHTFLEDRFDQQFLTDKGYYTYSWIKVVKITSGRSGGKIEYTDEDRFMQWIMEIK